MKGLKGAKGANIIIAMGVTVLFIAAFFIIFIFDMFLYDNLGCLIQARGICTTDMFSSATIGLFIIFFLLIMIAAAVYILFITFDMERKYSYGKGTKAERKREGQ